MNPEKVKLWVYKCLETQKEGFLEKSFGDEDIKDWTNEFLSDLQSVFEYFVQAFNDLKKENMTEKPSGLKASKETKKKLKNSLFLYNLTNQKGFMIFRKGYKLIFSYVQPGRIQVQFLKQKPFSEKEYLEDSFIQAITDDTMSINWVHENHKGFIDINVLARYYMKRFLQEI